MSEGAGLVDSTNVSAGKQFIEQLFLYAEDGFAATTRFTNGVGESIFRPATAAVDLWNDNKNFIGKSDIYFRLTTLTKMPEGTKRGENSDTYQGFALPIDFDAKDGWTKALVGEFIKKLEQRKLNPTVFTVSGHGWHVYLFYDEPLDIVNHAAMLNRAKATFIAISKEIAPEDNESLCVDTKVYDVSRVMRMPGSLNVKDPGNPVPCYVEWSDYDVRTSWADLDDALDPYVAPVRTHKYAIGSDDEDASLGKPGREFNKNVDAVELILDLFPGFYVTHIDNEDNVYIARGDRRSHGIVVYFNDQHVAIYSGSTLRNEMRIPPGHDWDKESPWWPFYIYAAVRFDGTWKERATQAARQIASEGYKGIKYGIDAEEWKDGREKADAEFIDSLGGAKVIEFNPTPNTPVAPIVEIPEEAKEPVEWLPGFLPVEKLFEALGFEPFSRVGVVTDWRLPILDGGVERVAQSRESDTGLNDGQLLKPILKLWPNAVINSFRTWQELLDSAFEGDGVAAWNIIADPDPEAEAPSPLLQTLRGHVQGVEGLNPAKEPWVLVDANTVVARPTPEPHVLVRFDGQPLLYERKTNVVFGPSESTKTWLCAIAALDCIRRLKRPVIWLDLEEIGNSQGAYRLKWLGATPQEMAMLWNLDDFMPEIIGTDYGRKYVNTKNRQFLIDKMKMENVGLVIIDSISELANAQDLDDSSKRDYGYLRNHFIAHVARVATVFMIDHTGHSTGAREAGTIGKRNAADGLRIYVQQTKKFTQSDKGSAILWAMKDRWSQVYKHCLKTQSQLEGENKSVERHMIGTFELNPGETITAGVVPPTIMNAPDPSTFGAGGNGGLPGPGTSTEDVILDMILHGNYESLTDATDRLKIEYGAGKDRVKTLMETLQNGGFVELKKAENRGRAKMLTLNVDMVSDDIIDRADQISKDLKDDDDADERAVLEDENPPELSLS